MTETRWHQFLCNGASDIPETVKDIVSTRKLEYRKGHPDRNVNFAIPDFVQQVQHLTDRSLDLLEIASYIYCADRSVSRGSKGDAVYTSWTQNISLKIRVRDHSFWSQEITKTALVNALQFMSGLNFRFEFEAGHRTPPAGILDNPDLPRKFKPGQVVLFSGGIDSLTGVCQALKQNDQTLYLISHRSQNITFRTQNQLFKALARDYSGDRVKHIVFPCNLLGERAREETQRTRFFLFSAMAFAAGSAIDVNSFYVFENGITSLNLPKSQQMMNARNSRTTHPKTLQEIRHFFSLVSDKEFHIYNPFAWMTKSEVVTELIAVGGGEYLSSSVSCSHTLEEGGRDIRPQCGRCSQCIDRRIAIYAAGVEDYDNDDLYTIDLITQDLSSSDSITLLKDYLRQAGNFDTYGLERFYKKWLDDLSLIVPSLDADEDSAVEAIFDLCKRHGRATRRGVQRMRAKDTLFQPVAPNSLLQILAERDYINEILQETEGDIGYRLIEELRSCPTGQINFSKYEKVGGAILRYLFRSSLGPGLPQSSTTDGTQRRDVLFRNNQMTDFFQRIFARFSADFVIVDFKNNGKPIGPKEINDMAKYGNKALGRFILLISRLGPNKSVKAVQHRLFRDEDKIVLVISDEQMIEMIKTRVKGGKPDALLDQLLDEFLISW